MKKMLRKVISALLGVCMILSLTPIALAEGVDINGSTTFSVHDETSNQSIYYAVINDNEVEVVSPNPAQYSAYTGEVTIPSTVTYGGITYTVTAIGFVAFDGSSATKVTLPQTITIIKERAFHGENIGGPTEIILNDGLKTIEAGAFTNCKNAASINLPSSLETIGEGAFGGCTASIQIPVGVQGDVIAAVSGYKGDTANLFPEGSPYSFDGLILYEGSEPRQIFGDLSGDIVIRDGATQLPNTAGFLPQSAFSTYGKKYMTGITIPGSMTVIRDKAFFRCSNLSSVILQEGIQTIGANAFAQQNGKLETITIPASVTSIGAKAFDGCFKTENSEVTMQGETPPEIGQNAFDAGTKFIVPYGSSEKYAAALGTDVSNIQEMEAPVVPVTSVSVAPAELNLTVGGTGTLTANVSPEGATDTVTWSSSDPAVATVENGVVTAVGVGEAIITATAGDASATCKVTVQPDAIPVTGVTVTADRTGLYNGEVAVLTATVLPENATDKTVTWTSSDETVATVDANGRVTAVSAGSVTITAAAGGVTSEAVFIVVQGPAPVLVGSVNVNPAALNLTEGDARALTATVGPENATNRAVVWTSSNPSVAAVDGNGVVTALRAGSAVITATAIDGGGASGSCTVAVSAYVDPFASYFPDYFDYPSNSGTTAPAQPAQPAEPETPVIPDDPTPTDPGTEITDEEVPLARIPQLFTDVKADDWHIEAVAFVLSKGIMGGTSETKFEPETNIDRGMIVTMLHRLEGTPEAAPSAFTDVKAEQYCAEAIGWASQNGVVQGYSDTEFRPTREISREQLASILYRYAQLKGYDTSEQADLSAYADAADVSGYALDGMRWAVAKGLISGVTESTLAPGGSATRAQAAMILMRFCENVVPA